MESSLCEKKKIIKLFLFVLFQYSVIIVSMVYIKKFDLGIVIQEINNENITRILIYRDLPTFFSVLVIVALFYGGSLLAVLKVKTKKQKISFIIAIILFILGISFKHDSKYSTYSILYYFLFIAFAEEIVYRGTVFSALEKICTGWKPYVISGILFALPHAFMPWIIDGHNLLLGLLSTSGMGITAGTLFAYVYKKSDSIWLITVIHMVLNLV